VARPLDDAEVAYQEMLRRYPQSAAAYTGLAYTAADRNQLSEALRILDRAPNSVQNDATSLSVEFRFSTGWDAITKRSG
jgi:thioredoxin-like negative regulator of GroEL